MNDTVTLQIPTFLVEIGRFIKDIILLPIVFFLVELYTYYLIKPNDITCLIFGGMWAIMLSAFVLCIPRKAGRILFGFTYYVMLLWAIAQSGYYSVFGKMMWISTITFADEGGAFLGDVMSAFPLLWWLGGIFLLGLGALVIWKFPKGMCHFALRLPYVLIACLMIISLSNYPETVFEKDKEVWGTRSEYGQSSALRARYNTMYDSKNVYDICGIYHMTMRDIWKHYIFPLTPSYQQAQKDELKQIDEYFAARGDHNDNEMTGIFEGKNVVLVLMESMDDWMITEQDTPTIYKMMDEGINFTNFYTPGYGSARTLNSEFCMNTGIYLPTTGNYVFNYVTNDFSQSIASQMADIGYSAEVFHYNTPEFYSRGVFEQAMGYNQYNCYQYYETDKNALYDDCLLFDLPPLMESFFQRGKTFNTIITRSAHLSYVYNEVLSHYALKKYPEYRGMYGSQEEDCARVKAKLVDDMFARLVEELEARDLLENTVIIGITDHYTYGYKNMDELLALSNVDSQLLLEKTPCFIWSPGGPDLEVTKTLNTADFVPTVLNLMGIDSPYNYLGQDAFDPEYAGYAFFPDGSWASDGVFCQMKNGHEPLILLNETNRPITDEEMAKMIDDCQEFISISNLLLTSNYYKEVR